MNNVIKEEKKIRIQFLFELMKGKEKKKTQQNEMKEMRARNYCLFQNCAHSKKIMVSLPH